MAIDRYKLAAVGEFLHGSEWRRKLARDLGPYHPQGARAQIDPRLVARWDTGEREIPPWVEDALVSLLTDYAGEALKLIRALQREW